MTRETDYVVFRHGCNRANQSMTAVAAVGTVRARSRAEAVGLMAQRVEVYANQYLAARPASRVSAADRIAADEEDRKHEQHAEYCAAAEADSAAWGRELGDYGD